MTDRKSPDWLYVARDDAGWTKVGISINPTERTKALARDAECDVTLIWECHRPNGDAAAIERAALKILAPWRVHGEWFSICTDEAVAAVMIAEASTSAGAFVRQPEKPDAALMMRAAVCEMQEWMDAAPENTALADAWFYARIAGEWAPRLVGNGGK